LIKIKFFWHNAYLNNENEPDKLVIYSLTEESDIKQQQVLCGELPEPAKILSISKQVVGT
jgi:hypothetical protein